MIYLETSPDQVVSDLVPHLIRVISPSRLPGLAVLPTDRLARASRHVLASSRTAFDPEQVTTMKGFCASFHERYGERTRLITEGESRVILAGVLDSIRDEVPFLSGMRNPGTRVLSDLLELREIFSARNIAFFTTQFATGNPKGQQIAAVLRVFDQNLTRRGLLDATALREWTISRIQASEGNLFGEVVVYGLFDPLPGWQDLLLAIREKAESFTFLYPPCDGSPPAGAPAWIAGEGTCAYPYPQGPFSALFSADGPVSRLDGLRSARFPDTRCEIETIAEEISHLRQSGVPLSGITVAFPDIRSRLSMIREVFSAFGIPWYHMAGEPVSREPLTLYLLLFLTLARDTMPRDSVVYLLSSTYFPRHPPGLPDLPPEMFDIITREAGITGGWSWEDAIGAWKERSDEEREGSRRIPVEYGDRVLEWHQALSADLRELSRDKPAGDFIRLFEQIRDRWLDPVWMKGDRADRLARRECAVFDHFTQALQRVPSLLPHGEPVPLPLLIQTLTTLLEEPARTVADRGGVSVMSIRETAFLDIPHLFLAGLNEGSIPYPSTLLPFLNSTESSMLGARDLEEVLREEEHAFVSALNAGRSLFLSAPQAEEDTPLLPSPFLLQVEAVSSPAAWGRVPRHSISLAAVGAGKAIAAARWAEAAELLPPSLTIGSIADRIQIEDYFRSGPPDSPFEGVLTGNQGVLSSLSAKYPPDYVWAPTRLEAYSTCPFRYFIERVVHPSPLPDTDPNLTASLRGTLVHRSLASFYKRWCTPGRRRVTRTQFDEAYDLLQKTTSETLGSIQAKSPIRKAAIASLTGSPAMPGLLERFLIQEVQYEDHTLEPALFEYPVGPGGSLTGKTGNPVVLDQDGGEPFPVQGVIDRIDLAEDGRFTIIDYKVRNILPPAKRIREGTAFQLPLYLLALERSGGGIGMNLTAVGASYYQVGSTVRMTWPLLDRESAPALGIRARPTAGDFRRILFDILNAARDVAYRIRNGCFPVPIGKCPDRNCRYHAICRFDRYRVMEDGTMQGDE